MHAQLINKYNIPGPRYTSYPTVPYWENDSFSLNAWRHTLKASFMESNTQEGISLYIHLPFCEQLCTFCGCTKRITKRHEVETPYINAVLQEWQLYLDLLEDRPRIREIHLGGGTPTFFSPENLRYLIRSILRTANITAQHDFSFEGHPANTTAEHLEVLYDLGFRRVSYGIQDYNETVQKAIRRKQSFKAVQETTEVARRIGYESVGHDLIYGLPFQTEDHIRETVAKTLQLLPDRIAFYSYAHVPWIKGNGQRGFDEKDLPTASEKLRMQQLGKELLLAGGYEEIGMDHYALKTDKLYKSLESNSIHRNFMGYTDSKTQAMIGLGVSAISDGWYGFAQNVKGVEEYQQLVGNGIIPVYRGHILTDEDLIIRKHILDLMCRFTTWWSQSLDADVRDGIIADMEEMSSDGLVAITEDYVRVLEKGKPFVRNIAMAFDLRLKRNRPETELFSMTV